MFNPNVDYIVAEIKRWKPLSIAIPPNIIFIIKSNKKKELDDLNFAKTVKFGHSKAIQKF